MRVKALDKQTLILGLIGALSTFIIGILIGVFGIEYHGGTETVTSGRRARAESLHSDRFEDKTFVTSVLDKVDPDKLRGFLQELSKEPHIAASNRDRELAKWIQSEWSNAGVEDIFTSEYDILFSYPNSSSPNKVHIINENGGIEFSSRHKEDVLRPEDEHPDFIHAFNAFTPAGDITGDLVYVHYGRVEDLKELEALGIDLKGKIAISRYGKIYRGNKLKNCEDKGAIGLIIFSDPRDYANYGTNSSQVYPNTFFLPESGIQRGSAIINEGDPLSPGWPSVEGAYRLQEKEVRNKFPGILCQPIGYGDARRLLELMGGDKVPDSWKGGLSNLEYRLGPGFNTSHKGWKVRLVTNNYLDDRKDRNVLGVIRGSVEPDRYILLSNHRDAWGYGAIDPSSGTASLMEVARVLGNLAKTGWRPRRTIVFASWCAEEYLLMGSHEFVFEHIQKIMDRAVAIINVDICIIGDILSPKASPILKSVFLEAIHAVPSTKEPNLSYYEFLEKYLKEGEDTKNTSVEDYVKILGSGSDHATFSFYAGVPALYFSFRTDQQKYPGVKYPTYHTGFETFYLMEKILDPGFLLHRSCTQLSLHMMLQLSESALLPLTLKYFVNEVDKGVKALEKANVTLQLNEGGAGDAWDVLLASIQEFKSATLMWEETREKLKTDGNLDSPLPLRMLNDQIMGLERLWLLSGGLPGRPDVRHAIFSPAKHNLYGGAAFPGISDLLHDITKLSEDKKDARFLEIRRHLSDLMILFRQAASWLGPLYSIQ